mmetsp:Transcript_74059/g.226537  ORF Transcript_74059/g.226537 Transcript_74059/m.226537 type:complete len:273 (-) Transcript_74059:80-898(-)
MIVRPIDGFRKDARPSARTPDRCFGTPRDGRPAAPKFQARISTMAWRHQSAPARIPLPARKHVPPCRRQLRSRPTPYPTCRPRPPANARPTAPTCRARTATAACRRTAWAPRPAAPTGSGANPPHAARPPPRRAPHRRPSRRPRRRSAAPRTRAHRPRLPASQGATLRISAPESSGSRPGRSRFRVRSHPPGARRCWWKSAVSSGPRRRAGSRHPAALCSRRKAAAQKASRASRSRATGRPWGRPCCRGATGPPTDRATGCPPWGGGSWPRG